MFHQKNFGLFGVCFARERLFGMKFMGGDLSSQPLLSTLVPWWSTTISTLSLNDFVVIESNGMKSHRQSLRVISLHFFWSASKEVT